MSPPSIGLQLQRFGEHEDLLVILCIIATIIHIYLEEKLKY